MPPPAAGSARAKVGLRRANPNDTLKKSNFVTSKVLLQVEDREVLLDLKDCIYIGGR